MEFSSCTRTAMIAASLSMGLPAFAGTITPETAGRTPAEKAAAIRVALVAGGVPGNTVKLLGYIDLGIAPSGTLRMPCETTTLAMGPTFGDPFAGRTSR